MGLGVGFRNRKLMGEVKLTDYGAASPQSRILSKEEERSAELARRAQRGDYDDGSSPYSFPSQTLS